MDRIMTSKPVAALALCLAFAACAQGPGAPEVTRADFGEEQIITDFTMGPPGAQPGACYGKDVTPGVVEHVTEQKLVEEAIIGAGGNIIKPAVYETTTISRIVDGRESIFFETPCPPRWTPDFIASIQRALGARGIYQGAVTGELDRTTREAIRSFQLKRGLNSTILSTESARLLGLVEIDLS